jgi:hypothetical protein
MISSNSFDREAILKPENHEGGSLGLVLINPLHEKIYSSRRGECKKALRWLALW